MLRHSLAPPLLLTLVLLTSACSEFAGTQLDLFEITLEPVEPSEPVCTPLAAEPGTATTPSPTIELLGFVR